MKRLLSLVLVNILLITSILSQNKSEIKIKIHNFNDSILLLTSYYGDKIRLVDTAQLEHDSYTFNYDSTLPGGIYMAVSSKKTKLFEFIVNGEKKISFTTDTSAFVQKMKIKGSEENKVFLDYVKFNEKIFKDSKQYSDKLREGNLSPDKKKIINAKIDSLSKISAEYKLDIINNKKHLFVSKLLASMRDVQIPDEILHSKDSSATYKYYKQHYWDNLDLSDSRFLRTPMLDKKLTDYFDKLVLFQPDTVIKEIDFLISKTKSSSDAYSYMLWRWIKEYQNPKYMGFDKVFVHLVEKYFENPEFTIENNSESVKKTLVDRKNKVKPLILGNKAPDLILIDTAGNYTSFAPINNKYLLILFYDYECGICKKEIKYLTENMPKWKLDIGVFAVNVNGDLEKWKEDLEKKGITHWHNVNGTRSVTADFHDLYDIYGTPVIYLLDENRKIIAKRMGAEQIKDIIERHEKSKTKNTSN